MASNDGEGGTHKVFILYCKEDELPVEELSTFLHDSGIDCDMDIYQSTGTITNWNQWVEKKVRSTDGYVLLFCGKELHEILKKEHNEDVAMNSGFIKQLSLSALISDDKINLKFLPIILDEDSKKFIPLELALRLRYAVSSEALKNYVMSRSKALEDYVDNASVQIQHLVKDFYQENHSLRSLYFKLSKQPEYPKPDVGQKIQLQPKKQWSKPKETNHVPTNGSIVSKKRADNVKPQDLKFTLSDLEENVSGVIAKCATALFTLHRDKAQKECDEVQLLLMTVNDSEFNAALFYMKELFNPESLTVKGGIRFFIGNFANISSALVQHDQGSSLSQHVAGVAMDTFPNLKAIIAVGVCATFGELGDVIISSKIAGCDHTKRDKDDKIISRDPSPGASRTLGNYLLGKYNWKFCCTKETCSVEYLSQVHHKPILSLSTLVACEDIRDKIRKDVCSEALGLEMEGIGVVKAIELNNKPGIHFIIVKAGCDYANEKKSKEWQPVAAMAAADLVHFQLSKMPDDNDLFTKKKDEGPQEFIPQEELNRPLH